MAFQPTICSRVTVDDGISVFYRSSGSPSKPTILLLHGVPSSSHQFRNLIPILATQYHVIAPDFPGFGFTTVPDERKYKYTFDALTTTLSAFVDALKLSQFAVYIFDYGAPVALRLALRRPTAITAIISQSGNAYAEGLGANFWAPLQKYWASGAAEDREPLRGLFTLEGTRWQYETGRPESSDFIVPPEAYWLDQALMTMQPGNVDIQLDLLHDYQTNVTLYPEFQAYLRNSKVPVLAVWGKNDQIFVPAGAEAFKKDVDDLELHWLDAGHFALEGNEKKMADYILAFLDRVGLS
ncbi:MAG: hypothetical protein M4579_000640 [Chaenotheca gracillima]|nr:MAG: hypothetical protein M4579_000640 [Chaenotheca gracillima]